MKPLLNFVKQHKAYLLIASLIFTVLIASILIACYLIINPYKKYIVTNKDSHQATVGIVFGAGVAKNGKPYKELQARLDKAADAVNQGTVKKLVLSGDNRFKNYDEPTAMFNYLTTNRKIPASKLQRDYAGRSTYESCERAAKVFGLNKAILFSAQSHLPRAIYLCRHFGVEAYGMSSGVEANNSTRRELLARVKAVYNARLIGERTVLGERITLN